MALGASSNGDDDEPPPAPFQIASADGGIEPPAMDRARAVRDGLIARGMRPDSAIGFAANALHESSAQPGTGPGDAGASHGLFQWNADRLARFQATHNGLSPEQTPLGTQLDYVVSELNGPESAARDAIMGANGPAEKAAAVSQFYLRPKDVAAEMQRRSATALQLADAWGSGGGTMAEDQSNYPPPYTGSGQQLTPSQIFGLLGIGPQQRDDTPQSFISKLGEAAGGGGGALTGADRESAGLRALSNLGIGLLSQSGWHKTPVTFGEALGAGLSRAQQSEIESQNQLAAAQQARLGAVKDALSILNTQQSQALTARGQDITRASDIAAHGIQQQQATTSAGELAVRQRAQQIEEDRLRALQNAPPLFPVAPTPPAPPAPPAATPPSGTGATLPPKGADAGTPSRGQTDQAAADVELIKAGMDQASPGSGSELFAGPGASTDTAPAQSQQQPVVPPVDGSKPFVFQPPPTPEGLAPGLTPDQKANLSERYRLAAQSKDPGAMEKVRSDMQAMQSDQQNRFNDWLQKQQDAQHAEWLQANRAWNEAQAAEKAAGVTQRQKQADTDIATGQKQIDDMTTAAGHARDVNTMLANLGPNLKNLPRGFTGQLVDSYPGIVPFLQRTGWITGQEADAAQILRGLTNYMSVVLKPAGNGALRNTEMDKFQSVLPTMLQSEEGQRQALGYLLNMNDRVIQEATFANKQFHRPLNPADPNGPRAYNMPPDLWEQMDRPVAEGGLGPPVPHYTGDMADPDAYRAYVNSQKPGRPYYQFYRTMDPKTNQPSKLKERLTFAPEED
jgi:hypothetical protein